MPSHILQAWTERPVAERFRTGVSLHSHTLHSVENLGFLCLHAGRIPLLGTLLRRASLDYTRLLWTPPLPAADAHALEASQIESLGLAPLVSLTDHDSIDAGRALHLTGVQAPISVEWSVPFGNSFLHLGIHNLPPEDAPNWMRLFAFWTARPRPEVLPDILAALHAIPGLLTVVNHPLWDEGGVGPGAQLALVQKFVSQYRPFLHALELNGLRSWRENLQVTELAQAAGLPVVSGGDRHGCEPNANLNLTNARTFAEFASEVRNDSHSNVLFLSQYRESHRLRCTEAVWDTLRDYPEYPGRVVWTDRCFFRRDDGHVESLTSLWRGGRAGVIGNLIPALRVFPHQSVRGALRFALTNRPFPNHQEEAAG